MKWKKVLGITAITLVPGGLVALGAWLAFKALRPKDQKDYQLNSQIRDETLTSNQREDA